MGLAASQARYLALLARKSNCEYEGQQINQSRLALSNQSADLFNQMMALKVPSTPSKSDYTIQKYSFTDGLYTYKIDKWNKLAESESDGYNYVLTYHYDSEVFTGFQKYKLDPQVQFSGVAPTKSVDPYEEVRKIQTALLDIEAKKAQMDLASAAYLTQKQQAAKKSNYEDLKTVSHVTSCTVADNVYTITDSPEEGTTKTFTYENYNSLDPLDQATIKENVDALIKYGAFDEDLDYSKIYYDKNNDTIAFKSSLDDLVEKRSTLLPIFHVSGTMPPEAGFVSMKQMRDTVDKAYQVFLEAESAYKAAEDTYNKYDVPAKIGNLKLTPLSKLTDNQLAAIKQVLADMKTEGIETNITKCFDTMQEEYDEKTYIGGIYSFEMAGVTYYTTYYDLYNSIVNGTGINHIDDQAKLPYYGALNVEKPTVLTSRALIEKDKSGRFITMRLEDDSFVYDLKSETETDEVAYEDAMNEYTYQRSLYDKQVSDINAKTSIIQRQDQNLELRLKQLDTEQSALNTEIDAVSKVVKDNIEKSFKTFSN